MLKQLLFNKTKLLQWFLVLALMGSLMPTAQAETKYRRVYDPQTRQYYYVPEDSLKTKAQGILKNPIVKRAAVGAAVGGVAGAMSDKSSIGKGAVVGAAAGAGTGFVDKSQTLSNHPLARTAIKGAIIGTGASVISDKSAVKGAVIGAGAGTGWHYLKKYLLEEEQTNREQY